MESNTRCAHEADADAGPDEGCGTADAPGGGTREITMGDAGTEATLALGAAAPPVPRPKLQPAHAAATATAIAAGRKAAGNARFGMLSVTPAMLRTISSSLPPNSALGHETRVPLVGWLLAYPYIGDDRRQAAERLVPCVEEHALDPCSPAQFRIPARGRGPVAYPRSHASQGACSVYLCLAAAFRYVGIVRTFPQVTGMHLGARVTLGPLWNDGALF